MFRGAAVFNDCERRNRGAIEQISWAIHVGRFLDPKRGMYTRISRPARNEARFRVFVMSSAQRNPSENSYLLQKIEKRAQEIHLV